MAKITLKGNEVNTSGNLLEIGSTAPEFTLVASNLGEATLASYAGKRKVLNIFPSLDTGTCAASVRGFNAQAANLDNSVVLCISKDLPFAQSRFCGAEGLDKVETLSAFRSDFAKVYGLEILDGPLQGLCSRSVIVLDENNKVLYSQQVGEIADEPNYEEAIKALS